MQMGTMSDKPTVNVERMAAIGLAMSCILFNEAGLDAALLAIDQSLSLALSGQKSLDLLPDAEENRLSAAKSMALMGALTDQLPFLNEPGHLEALLLHVDFFDADDTDEEKIVKGVMLECLMCEKVGELGASEMAEMQQLHFELTGLLVKHGYGGQLFSDRSSS